jgi:hypothetical protein
LSITTRLDDELVYSVTGNWRYHYGKVGQTGPVLGQGFTATTSVSINGIQANFPVVSDTFIRATVPADATTGYVTVTTPSGTLTSNVPFHVIP